jgi:CRISPR/Cas system CMR-associated protein Cmr5 small subunit
MSEPQRIDHGSAEMAAKYMHRIMSDEMKKSNATLDDSFITDMVKDVNRYCALPDKLKANSDDNLNIFILKSRDLRTKRYNPNILQLDILESASFNYQPGTTLSELILQATNSGNNRAIQIVNAIQNSFETILEGLELKYQLNCINLLSITATVVQTVNVHGFVAFYRTKKENYGRVLFVFYNDSIENAFTAADQALNLKLTDLIEEGKQTIESLKATDVALQTQFTKAKMAVDEATEDIKQVADAITDRIENIEDALEDLQDAVAEGVDGVFGSLM